jgi:hypothetical protein
VAQLVLAPVVQAPGWKWTSWTKPRAAKVASARPAASWPGQLSGRAMTLPDFRLEAYFSHWNSPPVTI